MHPMSVKSSRLHYMSLKDNLMNDLFCDVVSLGSKGKS